MTLFQSRRFNLDARLIISIFALVVLAVFFWSQSRYPALNEKALMGGDTPMSGLSFDIILDIFPNSPLWWEIIANVANWIFTNLKGMTFGVLFGAAMLTLLSVVRKKSFENGFANAALGAVIGAPLGVCVNCAAPIALGLHMGRMRLETTLSALIASPTLNVIVVTMSFSLLPVHVAGTKLLLSLIMILLVIPFLCKFWLVNEVAESTDNMASLAGAAKAKGLSSWIAKALAPREYEAHSGGFLNALMWYMKVFARNLFFIFIITVPMMFVAALLGALVASWFDTSALKHALPTSGAIKILFAMALLASVATFAPAPIALDIILTAILLGVGLDTGYATTILIALGTFSIYAFIILWRAISLKTALTIWVATMALAMTGGVIAKLTAKYERAYHEERLENYLANAPAVVLPTVPDLPAAPDFSTLQSVIASQQLPLKTFPAKISSNQDSIVTLSRQVSPNVRGPSLASDNQAVFSRISGQNLGLDELGINHPMREFAPAFFLGGIAAGDVHGDGWVDVITRRPTGAKGLSLYANIGGRFQRQEMALGRVMQLTVINVALADLDNDTQLDMVVTTREDGIFLFFNQGGFFTDEDSVHLPRPAFEVIISLSFGDMDLDGNLDIILGGWADGSGREGWDPIIPDVSGNKILWNNGNRSFEATDIPGSAGQTLTTLVGDFNGDGIFDLLKGDDLAFTDQVIFFSDKRKANPPSAETQPFEYIMRTSMSYDVGDWNNDLQRDYYGAQITGRTSDTRDSTIGDGRLLEICQQFGRDNDWDRAGVRSCAIELKSIDLIRAGKSSNGAVKCNISQRQIDTTLCFAVEYHDQLLKNVTLHKTMTAETAEKKCRSAFARLPFLLQYCNAYAQDVKEQFSRDELAVAHSPGISGRNLLMTGSPSGRFTDEAEAQGVMSPGFTWNSRFADLDQDGWQDLLVMTGIWLAPSRSMTNAFYRNNGGTFAEATDDFGFADVVPSFSYVSFDFDRDGDIDVIRDASASRMIVHRNDQPAGNALWVYLRDKKGNSMGIGATVIICTDGEMNVRPGKCQMRDVKASGGYMSFDPIAAHFGLGKSKEISFIRVIWPDGEVSDIKPTKLSHGDIMIHRD